MVSGEAWLLWLSWLESDKHWKGHLHNHSLPRVGKSRAELMVELDDVHVVCGVAERVDHLVGLLCRNRSGDRDALAVLLGLHEELRLVLVEPDAPVGHGQLHGGLLNSGQKQ